LEISSEAEILSAADFDRVAHQVTLANRLGGGMGNDC
jgi:hypothetical protein